MVRLIAVGLDGASLDLIEPWSENGELPYFGRMLREGIRAQLETTIPTETPVAIPSICSGKNPGKIGISGFLKKSQHLLTSRDLPESLVWELLSKNGFRCVVISVPLTYPAMRLNGYMISDSRYIPSRKSNYTYPLELKSLAYDYPIGIPKRSVDRKGYFNADIELENLTRDMAKKFEVTTRILAEKDIDFALLYINETDTMHHRIWTRKEHMLAFYKRLDSHIGELVERSNCRNIIIFSDHGNEKYPDNCFNVNTWLRREGFLKLKGRLPYAKIASILYRLPEKLNIIKKVGFRIAKRRLRDQRLGVKPPGIDWEATIAYGNDFGIIIFPENIPADEEYENVRDEIVRAMMEIKDLDGNKVIAKVCRREEIYWGDKLDNFPDIIFLTNGYQPNVVPYSADVIQKMSDKVSREGAMLEGTHVTIFASHSLFLATGEDFERGQTLELGSVYDIAPTILHLFGLPIPHDMDGRVPLEIFRRGIEPALREVKYEHIDMEKDKVKNRIRKLRESGRL